MSFVWEMYVHADVNAAFEIDHFSGVDATSPLVEWFWDVMEEFSTSERSLFLRYCYSPALS